MARANADTGEIREWYLNSARARALSLDHRHVGSVNGRTLSRERTEADENHVLHQALAFAGEQAGGEGEAEDAYRWSLGVPHRGWQ